MKCETVILKVASRCNLNCSYCYMYNLGDTTYREQPKSMSNKVVEATLNKIKNHCLKHNLGHFDFVFHGGEPLLAGMDFFENFVEKALHTLPNVNCRFVLQTNGTMVSQEWCELFARLDIGIGISLDGRKKINDMHRYDHAGRGSYDDVIRGLSIANTHKSLEKLRPGIISVINIVADPLDVYKHFKELNVTDINFLLPNFTYDNLPIGLNLESQSFGETPYADWLIKIFDVWFYEERKISIRILDQIVLLILGIDVGFESFGHKKSEFLVIETNGSIEAVDSLKSCGEGFTKAGANILTHEIEEALNTPLASLYHHSHEMLCLQCNLCPIVGVCGGGFLPHRYSSKNGFNNPSIYCKDLMKIITHIQNRVLQKLPDEIKNEANLIPLTYDQVYSILRKNILDNHIYDDYSALEFFKV